MRCSNAYTVFYSSSIYVSENRNTHSRLAYASPSRQTHLPPVAYRNQTIPACAKPRISPRTMNIDGILTVMIIFRDMIPVEMMRKHKRRASIKSVIVNRLPCNLFIGLYRLQIVSGVKIIDPSLHRSITIRPASIRILRLYARIDRLLDDFFIRAIPINS